MNEYDKGWTHCASFLCEVLGERVKKWREWDGVLANAIADDYEATIKYITEKQIEDNK
jgi:hypothetical protein